MEVGSTPSILSTRAGNQLQKFEYGSLIDGAQTVAYAEVGAENRWIENTKQVMGGVTMGPANAMVIVK